VFHHLGFRPAGGAGVPYAQLYAWGHDYGGSAYAYADWDGYYSIVGLQGDHYSITAAGLYEVYLVPGNATAEVIQGETITLNFVLGLLVPILMYPDDGTTTTDNTPWLDWTDVTDPSGVRYQLQVDDNADFSSPVLNRTWVSLCSTTLPTLPDGVYYWRVRAVDGEYNASTWISAWSLTLAT
jgi:hypothetical protein